MEADQIRLVEQEIDKQIAKVDRILDKRETTGQHFDDFLGEERARLYGMLQIYWLLGGKGYKQFQPK